jgi:membrane protease YdiL (CAAX protease family)
MHRLEGFGVGEPLLVLGLMGIGFSAFAWLTTRKSVPLPFTVKQPGRETRLLLLYMLPLIAYLAWGRNASVLTTLPEPRQSIAILAIKLLLFVAIPAAMLSLTCGYRWRELFVFAGASRHLWPALWMSAAIIAFQCVLGRGLTEIRHSGFAASTLVLATPLLYAFLLLEVGLVEEFFFRVLLQTRLSAWLKSKMGGIVGMALLFGLMHAPGLYYRSGATQEGVGAHPSWLVAIGYSVVITSVAGFFLGVLWMRTRNLLLVMAVHAAGDLVPNFVPMLKNWI